MTTKYHNEPSDAPPPYTETQDTNVPHEEEADVPRETIIRNTSNSIKGSYDLLDVLDLSTSSGSIDVAVTLGRGSTTAMFKALTSSGSIRAAFPLSSTIGHLQRDLGTEVATSSGSIRGNYILGSRSAFKSMSGKIAITAVAKAGMGNTGLMTLTKSGSHDIKVLSEDGSSLKDVDVACESLSGHIVLRGLLQGRIIARSTSGSIDVRGKGVIVEKTVQSGITKLVEARSGKGNGTINVVTKSGSIKIVIE